MNYFDAVLTNARLNYFEAVLTNAQLNYSDTVLTTNAQLVWIFIL